MSWERLLVVVMVVGCAGSAGRRPPLGSRVSAPAGPPTTREVEGIRCDYVRESTKLASVTCRLPVSRAVWEAGLEDVNSDVVQVVIDDINTKSVPLEIRLLAENGLHAGATHFRRLEKRPARGERQSDGSWILVLGTFYELATFPGIPARQLHVDGGKKYTPLVVLIDNLRERGHLTGP